MLEKIESLKTAIAQITASNKEEVEALRIKYLSKKGEISALFNDFRTVPNDQKKEIGQRLNELKVMATDKINALREGVEAKAETLADIDLTRPAAMQPLGTRHPLSLVRNERRLARVFRPQLRRRPPGTRYARHLLHPALARRASAHPYFQRANPCDDHPTPPDTHHLPGTRISQRGYLRPRTLFLPPSGSPLYRQKRLVCRP